MQGPAHKGSQWSVIVLREGRTGGKALDIHHLGKFIIHRYVHSACLRQASHPCCI